MKGMGYKALREVDPATVGPETARRLIATALDNEWKLIGADDASIGMLAQHVDDLVLKLTSRLDQETMAKVLGVLSEPDSS